MLVTGAEAGHFRIPFLGFQANLRNAIAGQQRQESATGQAKLLGCVAAGNARFLKQPQNNVLAHGLTGLRWRAEQRDELAG